MIRYIVLYCSISAICIIMCYLDFFIDNINYTLQRFLITGFELLSWIVFIIGVTKNIPKNKYSNKRVWFYYAIMTGSLSATKTIIRLIEIFL